MENIKISKEARHKLAQSIKRYAAENLDEEIGDLKASLLLDYILEEIGPHIYNHAIADAQAYMQEKVTDMENSCFALEGTYWKKRPRVDLPPEE
jgi:uncharacterized protein (DUF2164 family)